MALQETLPEIAQGTVSEAEQLLDRLVRINREIVDHAMASTGQTREDVDSVGNLLVGFAAMALLLQLGLSFSVARSIARRLGSARDALAAIAAGDYSRRVEPSTVREVQELSDSIHALAARLEDSETARSAISGNLRNSVIYQLHVSPDGEERFHSLSPGVERILGVSREELLDDVPIFYRCIVAADRGRMKEARKVAERTMDAMDVSVRIRLADGMEHVVHIVSSPRSLPDGSILWDGIATDITAKVRTEEKLTVADAALRTLSRCRHAIVHADSEPELLDEVCRSIVEESDYGLCVLVCRSDDGVDWVRSAACHCGPDRSDEGWRSKVPLDPDAAPLARVLATGEAWTIDDLLACGDDDATFAMAREFAVRGLHVLPLRRAEATFGALAVYRESPGPWSESEIERLRELVQDVEFGVASLRRRAREKALAEQLRVSDARFRSSMDQSHIGVAILDLQGRWMEVNDAVCAITGYSCEELIGRTTSDITHPEDVAETQRSYAAGAAGELSAIDLEKRYIRKDGACVWVRVHGSVVRDADGVPLHLVAHIIDDTQRHEAADALILSRSRMQLALEMAHLVYFEADLNSEYIHFGRGFAEIFGWPEDDSEGVWITVEEYTRRCLLPEDCRMLIDDFTRMRTLTEHRDRVDFEHPIRRADGSIGRVVVVRLFEAPSRVRGAIQDITERAQLREQLAQAQKMEAIGQLAGGVAHDFNNYLTVIEGYSQLLLPTFEAGDRRRERVEEIWKAAEASAALTSQLLAFSRREVVAPRVVDLGETIMQMQSMLRRVLGEDVRVTTSVSEHPVKVLVDPAQMQQVLMNLAVNARDAMPDGGSLEIRSNAIVVDHELPGRITSVPPGRYAVIAVKDTGQGMDEAVIQRIFDPFFTTKSAGHGTGLGLAVVYGIVQRDGGFIDVDSAPGRGTTVSIYLPQTTVDAIAEAVSPGKVADWPSGTETILVVEDEPSILDLTEELLARQGYRVLTAVDGEDALAVAAAHEGEIDLVISDVVMPRLGGGAMAARLRRSHPDLRVLFVSGYTDDAILRQGIASDTAEFLRKPYSLAELVRSVRRILDD